MNDVIEFLTGSKMFMGYLYITQPRFSGIDVVGQQLYRGFFFAIRHP